MSETGTIYRVVRGCVKIPGQDRKKSVTRAQYLNQGDLIPAGMIPEADLQSWLKDGRIAQASVGAEMVEKIAADFKARGKWVVDPVTLLGKTLEDLRVKITEVDANFDQSGINDVADAVRQLTRDWDPRFAQEITKASDRTSVEALRPDADGNCSIRDAGSRPMSDGARNALERARARAQSKAAESPES